jgi:uncharacterized membrane protein
MRKAIGLLILLLLASTFGTAYAQAEKPGVGGMLALPIGSRLPAAAGLWRAAETTGGFGIAAAVMAGMGLALAYVLVAAVQSGRGGWWPAPPAWAERLLPPLALAGLGVAGYLAYVEAAGVAAVCGPVGDCNAVQASPYAKLFGVLPMGLLGGAGYVAILLAWGAGRWGRGVLAQLAPLALFGMSLFAVLYSMYLTYLELYIIQAVCAWCLSSAAIVTMIMLIAVRPAMDAIEEGGERPVV